jgi:hypothetical protein
MPTSAPSAPVTLVLSLLKKVREQNGEWMACCPAHDDRNPSLSVSEGNDGRALVTCHAGCSFDQIVGGLGLTKADLFPPRDALPSRSAPSLSIHRTNGNGAHAIASQPVAPLPGVPLQDDDDVDDSKWPVVATYTYVDPNGDPVFEVRRKEPESQPSRGKRRKTFRQFRPGPNGWIAGIKEIEHRPLFRLPELVDDLAAERTIVLVEGEKDCETGRALGFPVTAHAGGSKGWRPEYGKQLANANVVIIIDNDEPGRAWAAQAGTALIENGSYVSMLALPLATEHADLTDWVNAGGNAKRLARLINKAVPWSIGDPVPTPPPPSKFKLLSVTDMENLPPLEWMAGEDGAGILLEQSLFAVYGAPGAGKSFVVADLACTIAAYKDGLERLWLGNGVRNGPVIYVAAEGGRGFRNRVIAWRKHYNVAPSALDLHFVIEPVNLFGGDDVSHILRAADLLDEPPVLVVFDTMARSMVGADENSAQDVGLVIDRAERIKRETGATVGLVHHANGGGETERGSTALRGGVDTLCSVREDEETGNGRILSCVKQKDADPFADHRFFLLPVGDSCVVSSSPPGGIKHLTKRQISALRALDLFTQGALPSEWAKASEIPERTFYRTRKYLITEGFVNERASGNSTRYFLTDSGRSSLTREAPLW